MMCEVTKQEISLELRKIAHHWTWSLLSELKPRFPTKYLEILSDIAVYAANNCPTEDLSTSVRNSLYPYRESFCDWMIIFRNIGEAIWSGWNNLPYQYDEVLERFGGAKFIEGIWNYANAEQAIFMGFRKAGFITSPIWNMSSYQQASA